MALVVFGRLFRPALKLEAIGQTIASGIPLLGNFAGDIGLRDIGLRVSFEVTRSMTPSPDQCRVQVFNLGELRRAAMGETFSLLGRGTLSLDLGYDGITSRTFAGTFTEFRQARRMGEDIVTEITGHDGGDAFRDAVFAAPIPAEDVDVNLLVQAAIATLNEFQTQNALPPPAKPETPFVADPSVAAAIAAAQPGATVLRFRKVMAGKASELLDEAARLIGARWWIRDNRIMMGIRDIPTDPVIVVINPDMMLSEPDDDGSGVVRVEAMFDPNLVPGRACLIQGDPDVARPPFQMIVHSVTQRGDTEAGPWSSSIVGRKVVL